MRVFFAIDLSGEIRQNISDLIQKCRAAQTGGVTYTAPGNLHVTLKFLGDLGDESVRELSDETAKLAFPVPWMSVIGAGAFPNAVFPRVLWTGVREEGVLNGLFAGLEAVAERHGVAPDGRPYHPHVTIGRLARGARAQHELVEIIKNCTDHFGDHAAPEFVLYQSELTRNGPVYTKIRAFPFGGGNG